MKRVLVVALLAAFVLPSRLSAHIVLDSCIGGVGLWDSSTEVLRQWGTPVRKVAEQYPRGHPDERWYYSKRSVLLARWGYEPTPNKVIVLAVTTTDPKQRTRSGIGVGSWLSEVRAAYPRRRCPRRGLCEIGGPGYGGHTSLRLKDGRVKEVSISLDSGYDEGPLMRPDPRCRRVN